jgi:hypothetical protein
VGSIIRLHGSTLLAAHKSRRFVIAITGAPGPAYFIFGGQLGSGHAAAFCKTLSAICVSLWTVPCGFVFVKTFYGSTISSFHHLVKIQEVLFSKGSRLYISS